MIDLIELGDMIQKARKDRGLNQTQLGELAGCSRSKIDRIENAREPEVGLMLLQRIMHAVDLDLVPGTYNAGRPTLDQLRREGEESDAPRMGR